MKYILQSVIIYLNLSIISGANILVFLPLPLGSHTRAFKPLFRELAIRGHNVTFYTALPFDENIPNLKQIVVKDVLEDYIQNLLTTAKTSANGWRHILFVWRMGIYTSEKLFNEPPIKDLIHSTDSSYDLILLETFFLHEPFVILGHKFNAPIINLHPFRAEEWISNILRNPLPLSYAPNFRMPLTDNMNFYERILNVLYYLLQHFTGHYYYIPTLEKYIRDYVKYPGSENLPPLLKLIKNTSLTLLDGSHIVSFPSPSLPNFIHVGGIHILPKNELPEDIKKYIDESSHGIVYFSLGSLVKVSTLPPEQLKIITTVLGSLKQRVLMKWEKDEKMPNQPSNVKTSKWFPQLDILAHPKCRAFITHGGIHSITEAIHFGVPIIGIPVFVDQESNIIMAIKKGFGELVKLEELSVEVLFPALDKVLSNSSYKRNAETLSKVMRDVPMSPLDLAVFWVEYVLRNKGANHLQVAGTHLPSYEYYLIDVIFAGITFFIVIIGVLYKLIRVILTFTFSTFNNNKIRYINKNKSKKSKKE